MSGVFRAFRRPRSRVLLCAAIVVLVAQGVATLVAPSAEARASQSAPAHVEAGGTHKHHSHNPNDCPACIALQITPLPERPVAAPLALAVQVAARPAAAAPLILARRFEPKSPRAPPLLARAR
ncbi:MAG TPA: DUF2946 family protein [Gemmatimonadaceae bacterium]|nr:DUF2946 family protein [Gemmatimonadaceae bacterium]